MLILKQSTSVDIRLGPFVDATDGVTPETGVTIAGADQAEILKANGAATVAMSGTLAAVTGADGWYDYTVQTGDVSAVGEIVFVIQDSDVCLPVFTRGYVVEEATYDMLYASGATPVADINAEVDTALSDIGLDHLVSTSVTGTDVADNSIVAQLVDDAATADWDNYDNTTASLEALNVDTDALITGVQVSGMDANTVTATAIQDGSLTAAKFASNCLTAAKFASDCITSAKIATDAIGSDELAAGAITEIWNHIVETNGSYTAQQVLSVGLAVLAGQTSSGGATFSDPAGTNTRVTATVNGSNERTAMTLNPSS